MSDDPKNGEDASLSGMGDDLNEVDRAMLLAISHRQRDSTPLSLEQERLLDSWIAGRLPSKDADRAAELTKFNKLAAERVLERRLIAVANEGPDVPVALSARILGTPQPSPIQMAASVFREAARELPAAAYDERPGAPTALSARNLRASRQPRSARASNLRWSTRSVWQWSGLSAAAAAIVAIAVFGFQVRQTQLRSNESQIAMVTIEDRNVLEEPKYRTRGRQQQAPAPGVSSRPQQEPAPDVSRQQQEHALGVSSRPQQGPALGVSSHQQQAPAPGAFSAQESTESRFRDLEVPTALLRRAINGASTDKGELEYSELMSYLRAQGVSFDRRPRIVIDDALAGSVSENLPGRTTVQIRAYDLDDPRAAAIRSTIRPLQADAQAILLTQRR
jgi:hypothetical protein